ncbi:hypothetical protein EG68_04232 [Paragonimus skrjabini miyazakii]|uniref:Frizzled-4 n=1 Tax=Paragonimus skrjabini miyazakii TaxID=59628 RepID=A0A8S9Z2C0_9TREM|nr:hypothetical protein EG68_04232 [Paragonimus skrjabini miyazakii]
MQAMRISIGIRSYIIVAFLVDCFLHGTIATLPYTHLPSEPHQNPTNSVRASRQAEVFDAGSHIRIVPETISILPGSQNNNNNSPGYFEEEDGINHCVAIHEQVCQGLQYTNTKFPNPAGFTAQDEAAKRMHSYQALITVGCSQYLKFFLCSIYFPMCTVTPGGIRILQPCQNFCRHVQVKCEPLLKKFSFPWPKELNCNALPSGSDMCIQPENYALDLQTGFLTQQLAEVAPKELANLLPELNDLLDRKHTLTGQQKGRNEKEDLRTLSESSGDKSKNFKTEASSHRRFQCTVVDVPLYPDSPNENLTCARRCAANIYYRAAEKRFADIWLLGWSILCASSCAMTLITFIIDRNRFIYPERPIVYISASYLCYSLGLILRIVLGRERVACRDQIETRLGHTTQPLLDNLIPSMISTEPEDVHLYHSSLGSGKYLTVSGHEGTWCTLVFIIIYYFSQASYIWWVMLTVAWFLSAACKWGSEGIESISSVLHVLAWALPAIKTMLILILHRIDADELTGLCFVGFQDRTGLLFFVLIPQIIYLLSGIGLLFIGFFALVSVRAKLKQHATLIRPVQKPSKPQVKSPAITVSDADNRKPPFSLSMDTSSVRRLDKLMVKICIFSVLYIIPNICVIGANLYSYNGLARWSESVRRMHWRSGCLSVHGTNWANLEECLQGSDLPAVEVNMLHIFMSLVVGITAGMWVWCNRKTFVSWSHCFNRQQQNSVTQKSETLLAVKKQSNNRQTTPTDMGELGRQERMRLGFHTSDQHGASTCQRNGSDQPQRFPFTSQLDPSPAGLSSISDSHEAPLVMTLSERNQCPQPTPYRQPTLPNRVNAVWCT